MIVKYKIKTYLHDNNVFHSDVIFRPWGLKSWLCPIFGPMIKALGAVSIRKTVLPGMVIPMLKIRRPNGRLIFNMEIAIRR